MRKVLGVSVLVVLLLVLGVSSALAEGFTIGAKVLYGNVGMRVDEDGRYGSAFMLYDLNAGWQATDKIGLGLDWTYGDSGVLTKDSAFDEKNSDSYSPYVYSNVKLDATVKVTDSISLLTGVTSYTASLDWNNGVGAANWYDMKGYGYKLGVIASLPVSDKLSASVKYAFLPYVYAEEKYRTDTTLDYSCVGTGSEFELAASYAISDGWKLNGGIRTDVYAPRTDCCTETEDVSLSAFYLGTTYSF